MNQELIQKIANELMSTKVMRIADLFEHEFCKIAMTAGELILRTSQKSIKYAKGCNAVSKRNDPARGRWTFSVKCHQRRSRGPYDVRFRLLKTGQKTVGMLGREVEISCNCNAWKYNGSDFNSLQKNYNERQYSDGSPPNVRDPARRYLICKHVAICVPLFKKFIIPKEFKAPERKPVLQRTPTKPGTPTQKLRTLRPGVSR